MRALKCVLIPLQVLSSVAYGLPHANREQCATKRQWKSWTALTVIEKASYINATLCLQRTPSKSGLKGALTRWDELQYAHIAQVDYIHFVAAFLPWHRYFLTVHKHLITNECGYRGPMPYWDEEADNGNLKASAIFDPETGFGGDGSGVYKCITDGPFANLTLRFAGDLSTNINYCIIRNLNDCLFAGSSKKVIESCMDKANFQAAWHCLEAAPHGAGHGGVGGIMVNVQLSPGDPLFWLHHGWLDKLWWQWQSKDPSTRLKNVGGPNLPFQITGNLSDLGSIQPSDIPTAPGCLGGVFPTPNGTFAFLNGTNSGNVTRPLAFPFEPRKEDKRFTDYFNDGGRETTLNHTLWSAGIFPNATIKDVMDLGGSFVCAEYV